jgi:hypothetical protein
VDELRERLSDLERKIERGSSVRGHYCESERRGR